MDLGGSRRHRILNHLGDRNRLFHMEEEMSKKPERATSKRGRRNLAPIVLKMTLYGILYMLITVNNNKNNKMLIHLTFLPQIKAASRNFKGQSKYANSSNTLLVV